MSSIDRLIESFRDEKTNRRLLEFSLEQARAMNDYKSIEEYDVMRDTMILFAATTFARSFLPRD